MPDDLESLRLAARSLQSQTLATAQAIIEAARRDARDDLPKWKKMIGKAIKRGSGNVDYSYENQDSLFAGWNMSNFAFGRLSIGYEQSVRIAYHSELQRLLGEPFRVDCQPCAGGCVPDVVRISWI